MTCVDHFRLSYDEGYANGDFASRLHDRSDISEELIDAFADLLSVVNTSPQLEMQESVMETGLFSHYHGSDEDHFDDAKEYHDDDE